MKGGATVVKHFKGGFSGALMSLFPDIGLERHKFNIPFHLHSPIQRERSLK